MPVVRHKQKSQIFFLATLSTTENVREETGSHDAYWKDKGNVTAKKFRLLKSEKPAFQYRFERLLAAKIY